MVVRVHRWRPRAILPLKDGNPKQVNLKGEREVKAITLTLPNIAVGDREARRMFPTNPLGLRSGVA